MTHIDDRIELLQLQLGRLRSRRDAAETGGDLHGMNQRAADEVNYQVNAYELARPTLNKLLSELDTAERNEQQVWQAGRQASSAWVRFAVLCGLLSVVAFFVGKIAPWWVTAASVVLLIGAALSLVAAHLSAREPNGAATRSGYLDTRIKAIETACADSIDAEGLWRVQALLEPASVPVRPTNRQDSPTRSAPELRSVER
jgi:hypothetical protein